MKTKPQKPIPKKVKLLHSGATLSFIILIIIAALLAYLYFLEKNKPVTIIQPQSCKCLPAPTASNYTASVGKFSLSLTDYVIIRQLDGGFEGGPITALAIGKKSADGNNVIDYPQLSRVEITAQPLTSDFDSWVSQSIASLEMISQEEQAPITIDGTSARVFKLNGLFEEEAIFFQKNGLVYRFLATSSSQDATQQMLTAVITNFKFTN